MFKSDPLAEDKIDKILNRLNENKHSLNHGRHLNADFCSNLGLKIKRLEDDDKLQDLVLSVHHAETQTFSGTPCTKIIETADKQYISFRQN